MEIRVPQRLAIFSRLRLPVGVSVDLHRFIEPGRLAKDRFPIRVQAGTIIVNPTAGVSENLDVGITNGGEITVSLVFLAAQCGMKRTEQDLWFRTRSRSQ